MKLAFIIMLGAFLSIASPVFGQEFADVIQDQRIASAIEGLDHSEPYWRESSIWKIGRLGVKTPEIVARLITALDDEEFDVQEAAAETLARIAPETKKLRSLADTFLMSDKSRHVRRAGYEIYRDIGNPLWADIELLRGHFGSGDWRRQRLAATLIDRSNNRNGWVKVYVPRQAEFVDELAACLADSEHEDLRYAAVQALDGLRHFSRPVLEQLIDHLLREPSKEIRLEILWAVEEIGVPENYDAVSALIEVLLNDEDGAVRNEAADALAIGWPSAKTDAIPALIECIGKDEHHSAPWSAAEAIAAIDPEGEFALSLLIDLLDRPPATDSAWEHSLLAIENLGPAAASGGGRVRELLEHSNPVVSLAAAAALGKISDQDKDAEIATLALFLRAESKVRDDAIRTLGELGSPAAASVLVESLADQNRLAIRHFQRAADTGEPDADYQLSRIFLNGPASLRDDEKAVRHLTRAAEKGHLDGCYELGLLYLQGDVVERNLKTAESWFRRGQVAFEADEWAVTVPEIRASFEPKLSERYALHLKANQEKETAAWRFLSEPDEAELVFILTEIGIGPDDSLDFGMSLNAEGKCISETISYGFERSGRLFPDTLQLTPGALRTIRTLHARLPPSNEVVPLKDAFFYSFHDPETNHWTTRIYHTRALPDSIREICRLAGHSTPAPGRDPRLVLKTRVGRIAAGAFSPGGALTISEYKGVHQWTAEGRRMSDQPAYDHSIFSMASDASRYARYGTQVQIISTSDFKPVAEFARKGYYRDSAFSENSRFLGFFDSKEETIGSHDADTGKLAARFFHPSPRSGQIAVSNDGKTLTGLKTRDRNSPSILIYREGNPDPVFEIGDYVPPPEPNVGSDSITELRFLGGDPNRLLIVTRKRVIKWDIEENRALSGFELPVHANALAASPTGRFAAARWGKNHPQVWVWDTETGDRIATLDGIGPFGYNDEPFGKILFSPHGKRIAAWNGQGRLIAWDLTVPY